MSSQATPGPWTVEKGTHVHSGHWVITAKGMPSGSPLAKLSTLLGEDEPLPDAHLIAAAPTLYAEGKQSALTMREAAKVFRGQGWNGMADILDTQAEKQEAILASARGEGT